MAEGAGTAPDAQATAAARRGGGTIGVGRAELGAAGLDSRAARVGTNPSVANTQPDVNEVGQKEPRGERATGSRGGAPEGRSGIGRTKSRGLFTRARRSVALARSGEGPFSAM